MHSQDGDAKFPFNISHDNTAVILACGDDYTQDIGVDVMKLELPRNETIPSFVEVLHDQVRISISYIIRRSVLN
jgi:phosphopantetheinyl transferase